MYQTIKDLSDAEEIGLSEFVRKGLEDYLERIGAALPEDQAAESPSNTRRNPCPTDI
jgi:hypothetical protein